ncbi:MAG: hypothetical protein ACE15D_10690 [Candidatus Eisenbacteria bacterium]
MCPTVPRPTPHLAPLRTRHRTPDLARVRPVVGLAETAMLLMLAVVAASSPVAALGLCGPWEHVPTPNAGNSVNRLTAITALSPSDAWSVGLWRNEPAGSGPIAIRWNGSAWNFVDLPPTDDLGTNPETVGVDHAPNGDVWIAGNVTTSPPANNLPLVMRWRNDSWDYVDTVTLRPQVEYPYADRGGFAYEVEAIAHDDVWAVGIANGYGDASSASVPMALHWDGSEWTDVDVPLVANRHHELDAVVAIASDDVWAAGDYRNIAGTFRAVTYHWDGHEWSHVPSPMEDIHQSGIEDLVATGPNDVWAIGGSDADGALLMRWNGSQWTMMPPPPNSGGSLAAVAPNDLWSSGWNGYWHWDGVSWTEVPADVPGATYVIRSGGMEIVGDCDIWTAGFWTLADGITSYTLAERLHPAPASVETDMGPGARLASLAFPNPFRPGNEIRLAATGPAPAFGGAGACIVTIHDVQGSVVRRIELPAAGGEGASASAAVRWDGRSEAGMSLPTGVYFARLESTGNRGERAAAQKLLLLGVHR